MLMVTKEAAMSFSQFGYPYNATSQVRPPPSHRSLLYCLAAAVFVVAVGGVFSIGVLSPPTLNCPTSP